MIVLEEDKSWVSFLHNILRCVLSTWLITINVDLDHLAIGCLPGFFIKELLILFLFQAVLFESHYE